VRYATLEGLQKRPSLRQQSRKSAIAPLAVSNSAAGENDVFDSAESDQESDLSEDDDKAVFFDAEAGHVAPFGDGTLPWIDTFSTRTIAPGGPHGLFNGRFLFYILLCAILTH
jgi:hypothetical protein